MAERNLAISKKHESITGMSVVRQQPGPDIALSLNTPTDDVLFLQRTAGNQAVENLFRSGVMQAKLEVGRPDDVCEQEADRVAEQVMRIPDTAVWGESLRVSPPLVQCREIGENEETIQAKSASIGVSQVTPGVESSIDSMKGVGEPLDAEARAFFEPRFGHDFSRVRVHDNPCAYKAAKSINALAYHTGRDLIFRSGQYAPGTAAGRKLLAHELAHVVQHDRGPAGALGIQKKEDWDFTRDDYNTLKNIAGKLEIASDSLWFPQKLQTNLLNTLNYLLGSTQDLPGTEGVNTWDLYHGHVGLPRYAYLQKQIEEFHKTGDKIDVMEDSLYAAPGRVPGNYSPKDAEKFAEKEKQLLRLAGDLLSKAVSNESAVVIYHTFEVKTPSDLKQKGLGLKPGDPRRNYIVPLKTNQPRPYRPPDEMHAGSWMDEYWLVFQFSFLVDENGKVHVRTGSTRELSGVTGKQMD